MLEQVNEPIEVATVFKEGKAIPFKFLWNGKEYPVKKINLAYSSRQGRTKLYFFAVSDNVNYFKLQFDAETLHWTLLESYVD